jgi:hypothetical protein
MIATLLFTGFVVMMLAGVPLGAALGLIGAACIALANSDAQWFGLLAVPQNFYAGLGKYPLLAIPMFVLVGAVFDRSGVARRIVDFGVAIVGRGPGMLPLIAVGVAMFMGGMYLAIDSTAGERERGSLEPLFTTPAPRAALVYGKILATASYMLVSLTLTVLACAVVVQFLRLENFGMSANLGPGTALALIAVDGEVPETIVEKIKQLPGVQQVKPLKF